MVPSWHGLAAIAYQERCGTYEQAANLAAQSLEHAGAEMRRYGHLYDEAHARIERLQRAAEECLKRIKVAEREAAERERAARERAAEAATRSPLDGGYSLAEHADAVREAEAAADDRRRYEAEAEAEREELERLQKEALEEHERIRQAGRQGAAALQGAVAGMPRVVAPAGPARAPAQNGGNVGDFLAGGINEFTFGLVDLGGDKDSGAYEGGQVASYVPWNPASAIKSVVTGVVKGGVKLFGKRAAKEGVGLGARRADNEAVQNTLNRLYKPDQKYGGGTAGALREEARTGIKVHGADHRKSAEQNVKALQKILGGRRGSLSKEDRYTALRNLRDLQDAIRHFDSKRPGGYVR